MPYEIIRCQQCRHDNQVPTTADGPGWCASCGVPLPWVADAGEDTFSEQVEQSTMPVIIDLRASWCGPCRMVSPALERAARDHAGRIKLVKIDVDAAPKLSRRLSVETVPTMLVMSKGEVVARRSGAASTPVVRRWVGDVLEIL